MARAVVVGAANWERTWRVDALPSLGETVLGEWLGEGPGGKGFNVAVALGRLGMECALVAAVGDDECGAALRRVLEASDVGTLGLIGGVGPSAQAAVLRCADDCAIAVGRVAATALTAEAVTAALDRCGERCQLLVLSAEVDDAPLVAAAEWAAGLRAQGGGVGPGQPVGLLSCAPARPLPTPVWAAADVAVANAGEAAALSGRRVADPVDAEAAAVDLAGMQPPPVAGRPRVAVVTLGGEGAVVARRGRATYLPPFRVEVVDPTGAGECFCAALGVALVDGLDVFAATGYALAAAAVCAGRPGAVAAMPDREDVDRMAHAVDLRRDPGMHPLEFPG